MVKLPQVLDAQELHTLDAAGLKTQLGLSQEALDLLHQARKDAYEQLTITQKELSEKQNKLSELKNLIKINTNETNKFYERIKVIKLLIRAEANNV